MLGMREFERVVEGCSVTLRIEWNQVGAIAAWVFARRGAENAEQEGIARSTGPVPA